VSDGTKKARESLSIARWALLAVLLSLAAAWAAFGGAYPNIAQCSGEEGTAKAGCCAEQLQKCVRTCPANNGGCMGYCNNMYNQCMQSGPLQVAE